MSNLPKHIWGPACWTLIHTSAATCESEDAPAFVAFLYSLTHVLPCPECREHLRTYFETHPPEGNIRDAVTASRYCFDLHNYVNHQTQKAQHDPSVLARLYDVRLPGLVAPEYRAHARPRPRRPYRRL